jgi:hypothetical integral membrane protein (TIGR02206 family)
MNVWSAQREFVAYGPSHLTVLALFVVGVVVLVWVGRRQSEAQARRFSRVMAGLLLAVYLAVLVYKLFHPVLASSVPLQLCDIAELAVAYALWSQTQWAYALTYYWGLVLSSQALLTPDVDGPDFPDRSFLTFFALHLLVVWAAVYLTWGRGMRPNWRSYRLTVVVTLAWAVFTLIFNLLAGTNYGYLNRKPPVASILDFLGPWPVYLLVEITLVAIIWALMTWPWERKRQRAAESSAADDLTPGSSTS